MDPSDSPDCCRKVRRQASLSVFRKSGSVMASNPGKQAVMEPERTVQGLWFSVDILVR